LEAERRIGFPRSGKKNRPERESEDLRDENDFTFIYIFFSVNSTGRKAYESGKAEKQEQQGSAARYQYFTRIMPAIN